MTKKFIRLSSWRRWLVLALMAPLAVHAAVQFNVQDLGTLPTDTASLARAINDLGQVVGDSYTAGTSNAFVWDKTGGIQPLPLPSGMAAGSSAGASGINVSGRAVGAAGFHGVLWDAGGATDLTTLPGGQNFIAFGINDGGTVIGSGAPGTVETAAFVSGGMVHTLRVLDASDSFSRALAVNNGGDIVGQSGPSAVIWSAGIPIELASNASARAINDTNGIAGVGTAFGQPFQAVLWLSGSLQPLPNPSGIAGSVANGINDANIVVGHGGPAGFHPVLDPMSHRALLWEAGVGYDLNTLLPDGSGWTLLQALDINNRGEIVGLGFREGEGLRAFLLTPVPEPAAACSMVVGLAVLWLAFRARASVSRRRELRIR
jgi:probable HAF family extracellular repeat protein